MIYIYIYIYILYIFTQLISRLTKNEGVIIAIGFFPIAVFRLCRYMFRCMY